MNTGQVESALGPGKCIRCGRIERLSDKAIRTDRKVVWMCRCGAINSRKNPPKEQ